MNDDLAAQVAAIRTDETETKTPAQILKNLPSYLPLPKKLELPDAKPSRESLFSANVYQRELSPVHKVHHAVTPSEKSEVVGSLKEVPPQAEVSPLDKEGALSGLQKEPASPPFPEETESASSIEIPQEDLKPLFDFSADCKACQITAAKQKQAIMLLGQEVESLRAERDAALNASKGGGFWSRLKSNAHWFAIGGAVAAGTLCATGHCK